MLPRPSKRTTTLPKTPAPLQTVRKVLARLKYSVPLYKAESGFSILTEEYLTFQTVSLMQMITLHPEQHIRNRKQRQCRKQVNPLPNHKRKPTSSRSKPHNSQDSYKCQCRQAAISKILVNENAPNRHITPKYQKALESCIIPLITPKFGRLIHLSATVPSQSPRNSLSRTRRPPLTFWYSEEA